MSTTGKTPVSILQETLLRQGLVPFYELMESGVGTHQGVFTYCVTAGPVSAVGSGRSKKEAKHEAAKFALEKMKVTAREPLDEEALKQNVTSPYEASMKDNAVGTLGEICCTHELPIPEYNQIREGGPPHAKMFVFACKVSTMEEVAQGRTKKQAKQLAADKMLNHFIELKLYDASKPIMQQQPHSVATEGKTSDSGSPCFNESYKSPVAIGAKISDISNSLQDVWTDEQLATLRALRPPVDNPIGTLEETCRELSLDMVFDKSLKECGAADGLLLILSTKPQSVFYGEFPNAEAKAASKALLYLKVMTLSKDMELDVLEMLEMVSCIAGVV